MIQQTTTEYNIKRTILFNIPSIVFYEFQVRKISICFDVITCRNTSFTHFQPNNLESHTSKLYREATLQTSKINES